MSLVQDGNASATTASGEYGLAIAYGDGATATAEGGTGNYALADGAGTIAAAGGIAGSTGNNFDSAIDFGNNSNGFSQGADAVGGNGDSASYLGNTTIDNGTNGRFAY